MHVGAARKRGAVHQRRVVPVEVERHAVQVHGHAQVLGQGCGLLLPVVGFGFFVRTGVENGAV